MTANTKKAIHEFEGALNQLIGLECWSILQAAGSWVLADIGAKIRLDEPIRNKRLTEEQRNYEGEYKLHVQHCAWRIETPQKTIACWRDDNSNKGRMIRTLHKIAGRKVQSINLSLPSLDLKIHFEDDMIWQIFCDLSDEKSKYGDVYENYVFTTLSKHYAVVGRSHLEIIERRKD